MKNAFAKLQAKVMLKTMNAQEGIQNFVSNEASIKGTSEEGTNTYGGLVVAIIFIGIVVIGVKIVGPALMDNWEKGTTKMPASWN